METLLVITLLVPLVSAATIALFLRKLDNIAAMVSVGAAGVAAITGLIAAYTIGHEPLAASVSWLELGSFDLRFGFLFDGLASLMLVVVVFVGFLIHVFSLGYMAEDGGKARYFGGLSIFMFSMLGIVLSDNLLMIFVFWELVGFSSYLLIGHYLDKPSASAAARKAFVVNRVGDFGFLLGILFAYWQFGTVELSAMAAQVGADPALVSTGMGLLLFCGVLGKSAQVPLHVWLPDAMEGPTPVSALIHAATMVAAGVYFLCRTVFLYTPEALGVIAWVGTITAVLAAVLAFGQNDIKKVLAYSTLSQLGYMVAAVGIGSIPGGHHGDSHGAHEALAILGPAAAMFHLTTHAFFKALLFLGSGSIIHACHHEQNFFKYGGLMKKMPVTFVTFTIGTAALIGFPFLAGYFSKDAILHLAMTDAFPIFLLLTFTALLTAAYMGRLWWITFFGAPRSHASEHAHENRPVMTAPLVILGILSLVGGGVLAIYPGEAQAFLAPLKVLKESDQLFFLILSAAIVILGFGFAALYYRPGAAEDRLEKQVPGVFALLRDRLYIDDFYRFYVDRIQQPFARLLDLIDKILIGGLLVRGSAGLTGLLGLATRSTHTGSLHGYVYWFAAGAFVIVLVVFLGGGQ